MQGLKQSSYQFVCFHLISTKSFIRFHLISIKSFIRFPNKSHSFVHFLSSESTFYSLKLYASVYLVSQISEIAILFLKLNVSQFSPVPNLMSLFWRFYVCLDASSDGSSQFVKSFLDFNGCSLKKYFWRRTKLTDFI